MIYESHPWKQSLLKDADIIERWSVKQTHSEYRSMLIEKKIFLSAFAIRRLIESHKITDKNQKLSIPCHKFIAKKSNIDLLNRHDLERHYKFNSGRKHSLRIGFLCNQIIHSFVFEFLIEDAGSSIQGFFVCSDMEKNKALYEVRICDYLSWIRAIGNDNPSQLHIRRSQRGIKVNLY